MNTDNNEETIITNIIKHLKSNRKKIYSPIKLTSYYKSRDDFEDITYSFGRILENVFCEEFGINPNDTMINIAENSEKIISKFLTLLSTSLILILSTILYYG